MSNVKKDLTWTDSAGHTYHYYNNPMRKATLFVLIQEMCERLAFYGIMPLMVKFIGKFLNMEDADAASYVQIFKSLVYFTPLLSAILADTFLGLYLTIVLFSFIYMSGLGVLVLSSVESITSPWMVHLAMMVLIPLGSGGIKSCVNVMGAKQFHPEMHKAQITQFYTYFYGAINLGALVGGLATPILKDEYSYTAAFSLPLVAFMVATAAFIVGDFMGRFVKPRPQGSAVLQIIKVLFKALFKCSLEKCKKSKGGEFDDSFIEDAKMIFRLIPLFSLIIPFNIAYDQMNTTWITQAYKMDLTTFSFQIQPEQMNNVDPIGVILATLIISGMVYPFLAKRNMMPSLLIRCFMGAVCAALAFVCALAVEYAIMANPLYTVSIWWQVPQFLFLATGEIFLISSSYEVAFTMSPESLKAVSSSFNLLFFAIASSLAGILFQVCKDWMPSFDREAAVEGDQTLSHYDYFFMVLICFTLFGALEALALIPYFNKVTKLNEARLAELQKESDAIQSEAQ